MADELKDLAITPVTSSDTNYFLRKVTGLKIDRNYSFKFQWVFEDDTKSDWSPGYQINTPTESIPTSPNASVPTSNASYIPVTLPTFPTNAKRVDVYIVGGAYGTGKVADSFLQAGTKSISVGAGTYQVSLITVSPSGINGAPSNTFTITITDPTANIQSPEASKTPSAPSVSSVLGAIQVTWNGRQADGTAQPYGFTAAKVYVGTTAGFTPLASNQVDAFNFKDGQNVINIGVGTLVDGVPMTYGVDYYVKIATTNGTDTSTPVSATGNPQRIGKVGSGDIVSVLADQITTGTLSSTSTVTVGTTSGKHVKLAGTGDPLIIYGSGGVSNPVLSFNGNKLTIAGDGAFTGSLTGASGTFGPVTIGTTGISSTNFSIASDGSAEFKGILTASGGKIGDWYINATTIRSSFSATATPRIELDPLTPQIVLAGTSGTISISPINGIVGPNVTIAGNTGPGFSFSPNGTAVLRGTIYANQGIFSGSVSGANITMTGTVNGYGTASTKLLFQDSNYAMSAGSSSFEYPNTDGYYDADGEWVSTGGSTIVTNSDIRFTDNTWGGAVPTAGASTFSYGELWLGSGTGSTGTVDLFANYPGDYIGISLTANATTQNIIIKGPTSAGFETVHRSSASLSSTSESPAFLQVDSSGRLTRGRAIFSGGSSAPSSNIGLQGDLYFSTAR